MPGRKWKRLPDNDPLMMSLMAQKSSTQQRNSTLSCKTANSNVSFSAPSHKDEFTIYYPTTGEISIVTADKFTGEAKPFNVVQTRADSAVILKLGALTNLESANVTRYLVSTCVRMNNEASMRKVHLGETETRLRAAESELRRTELRLCEEQAANMISTGKDGSGGVDAFSVILRELQNINTKLDAGGLAMHETTDPIMQPGGYALDDSASPAQKVLLIPGHEATVTLEQRKRLDALFIVGTSIETTNRLSQKAMSILFDDWQGANHKHLVMKYGERYVALLAYLKMKMPKSFDVQKFYAMLRGVKQGKGLALCKGVPGRSEGDLLDLSDESSNAADGLQMCKEGSIVENGGANANNADSEVRELDIDKDSIEEVEIVDEHELTLSSN